MNLEVKNETVNELLEGKELSVLDFWAPWCGPCRILGPIIDDLKNENIDNDKVGILKINVDENSEIAIKYGIRSIPTVLFIKNNEVIDKVIGISSKEELQNKIKSNLN